MLTQGKTSKVLIAAVKREPVVHIGEGSDDAARCRPSPGPYGQSLTAQQVEGLHLTISGGCEVVAAIPPRPEGRGFSRRN